jgi:hypothetical protein
LKTSERLSKRFQSVLREILFDSYLGAAGDKLVVRNVAPTSASSAEIAFELKLVNSGYTVDNADLRAIINAADERSVFLFVLEICPPLVPVLVQQSPDCDVLLVA